MRFRPPQFQGPIHDFHTQPWWHTFAGWFIPVLLLTVVAGLIVWGVLRLSAPARLAVAGAPGFATARRSDGALELARTRYAKGEITRDEFVQLSNDLGEPIPNPLPEPPPGDADR